MTLISIRKSILAAALTTLVAAGPTLAQTAEPPLREEAPMLVLEALGQRVTMPAPDWLSAQEQASGAVRPLVETIYRAEDTRAVLEILPKGETEALWNTLYGVHVMADASRPIAAVRNEVVARYARDCKPALTAFFQLGQDEGENLAPLGFVCGGYRDTLTGFAGKGEVMVMSFKKTETGTALVFQEWRGAAFDPSTPATWPVPTAQVEARARQLQADTTLAPAD